VIIIAWTALILAAIPAVLYLWNSRLFRPPPPIDPATARQVSVLIPARNEEASIAACVASVLASTGVELEVIVLDDHSTDRTAEIVTSIARGDPRVRVESAPPLPAGWCGKQHACSVLARLVRFPVLAFVDADVRLTPDGLARMARFLDESGAALVSGLPRQETGTLLEKLVIPLINWLLLCYLPFGFMRRSGNPAFGAGCGQWFMTRREDYDRIGGHAAVRASLHDGLTLPRAYRKAGLGTDLCDATDLAVCRMYRTGRDLWTGFAKNAREGMAAPKLILPWTILLLGGHVLPFVVFIVSLVFSEESRALACAAIALSYVTRLHAAIRFRQSWLGGILHPLGVTVLVGIQWFALLWTATGGRVGWKGRSYSSILAPEREDAECGRSSSVPELPA
jgi:glycosyltransferase involved in cell wall biosynthesis